MNASGCPIRSYLPCQEHLSLLQQVLVKVQTSLIWQLFLLVLFRIRDALFCCPTVYIILASPRSGSTFLVDQLNRSADLVCRGEILNPRYGVYGDLTRSPPRRIALHIIATFHSLSVIFSSVRAVGAKFFHDHLTMYGGSVCLGWLLGILDHPKVIFLRRENLLESYISLNIAFNTDIWYSTSISPTVAINLDL
jgi:hypothetical protein